MELTEWPQQSHFCRGKAFNCCTLTLSVCEHPLLQLRNVSFQISNLRTNNRHSKTQYDHLPTWAAEREGRHSHHTGFSVLNPRGSWTGAARGLWLLHSDQQIPLEAQKIRSLLQARLTWRLSRVFPLPLDLWQRRRCSSGSQWALRVKKLLGHRCGTGTSGSDYLM